MAGKGSKPGERRGGRKKGTPNKANESARATLAKYKLDPMAEMIKVYRGEIKFETAVVVDQQTGDKAVVKLPASEQTRFRALVELIKRQYPELSRTEVSGPDGSDIPATAIRVYFGKKPE